jgi:hypothetical protein
MLTFLGRFSMRKTSYRLIYFHGPFSPPLDAYSFTVTVFKLFSACFDIFTPFVSLFFRLFSELSTPERKNAVPDPLFVIMARLPSVITRRSPAPSYYRAKFSKSASVTFRDVFRSSERWICVFRSP